MKELKKRAHCSLWDNLRLKWPQTIMGREKAKCRRKATLQPSFQISAVCAANMLILRQARACAFTCVRGAVLKTHLLACHPHCNASAPTLAAVMTELIVALLPHSMVEVACFSTTVYR